MAGETTITVIGNLTDDPELRFTPSGAAVAKFRIASTPRTLDRATGEWKDALAASSDGAQRVAESFASGGPHDPTAGRGRRNGLPGRGRVRATMAMAPIRFADRGCVGPLSAGPSGTRR